MHANETTLRALATDDVRYVNHRSIATWDEADYASWLELQEALWESAPDARYSPPEFVEGDSVVGITRWRLQGHMETGGGDWTITFLITGRQRGGRFRVRSLLRRGRPGGSASLRGAAARRGRR